MEYILELGEKFMLSVVEVSPVPATRIEVSIVKVGTFFMEYILELGEKFMLSVVEVSPVPATRIEVS